MRACLAALLPICASGGLAFAQAAGDPDAGSRIFTKCRACHQIGEGAQNAVGPVLNGIVGRPAGTYPGYSYSAANKGSGITWDEAAIRDYLHDPKLRVPGTKMVFAGIRSERELDNLLAFLRQFDPAGRKAP